MQDYIMRMIDQFVKMLIEIIRARKAKNYEEATVHIQTASRYYLKTDIHLLMLYNPEQLLEYFKTDDRLDTERCFFCAELMHELALIYEGKQQMDEANRLKTLCINLYAAAIPKDKQFQTAENFEKVSALIQDLELPDEIVANVKQYLDFLEVRK